MPNRTRRIIAGLALLASLALLVGACGPAPAASSCCASQPASAVPSAKVTTLRVGLGYIGSVQFAPFYLAQQAGYYRDAGLEVTFDNRTDTDVVVLVGQGALDMGVSDGTSVIPAVSQGIPVRYVATIYGTYPSIVFAKASSGIKSAADLRGKKIGIPGKYGSSWIMLQALLQSAGLTPDDVTILEYPEYGQGVAVQQGAVDAATGFVNNEPVQLERSGSPAVVLHVDEVVALPGPGLISSTATLGSKGDAVAAFIAATLRAMTEIAASPTIGLDAAIVAVPELGASRALEAAILDATIKSWLAAEGGGAFGAIDAKSWEASIAYMTKLGLVAKPVTVTDVVRADLLPPG
ncbi:MAG: ABC transporter substrate-binding protein [Chloroflexi bacterium]|nr:ABC transporter substrate-binding protein [Chloroflexota bacterium]